jgi:DeoR/GlpR family transcriptional regulator of sugar metabolism
VSLDSNVKQSERKQKLYTMLKAQHEAEVKELMHYMSVLQNIQNTLIRNYLHTLLYDGLKHIEYISNIMTNIEGATGSSSFN